MLATHLSRLRWILAVLGLCACTQAHALDMEYYVYNGFDDALGAFQRLALIFSDSNYITLFTAVIILAFVLAATVFATRGLTGGAPMDVRSWVIPLLVGAVIFRALILPKGTIYLYDPVRNENQAIGGVPDAIVVVAGTLNLLERGVVDIVDTASAYPYANEAGGITFDLIYRATAEWNDVDSFYYTMSLGRYFTDCGLPALASQAYSVNMDQLKRGTSDFRTLLEAMASPANYTVYYDAANKAGLTMTCATDWQVNLSPFLNSPGSFDGVINGICAKAGLNMSSANQRTRCRELLATAATQAGAIGTDAVGFVRQAYIASAIDRAMQDKDPDLAQKAVANRNLMIQGTGAGNYINEWMPTIRAVSLGIVLGMIPVVALFVVTPLVGQALLITAGMLVWFTMWGVTDAIMHQMAVDGAQRVFQRISDFQLGLDSIWLMPEASTKSLAYFGKIRGMSMAIATALCGLLFKMSGSLFSGAQELAQATETAGADAGRLTQTTEGRAQLRQGLVEGQASELTRARTSMDNWTAHSAYSSMSAIGSTTAMLNAASQHNMSMNDVLQVRTASEGGGAFGNKVQSIMNVTTAMGGDPHNISDVSNTAQLVSEAQQTLGTSSAAAFHQTMERLGDGDATKGALRFAGIQAMQRYTGSENIARLAEMARAELQKAGAPADELEGYRALAQVMMSQTQADLSVFGTPDQLAGFLRDHRALDKGRIAAIADVAQKYGYSVEQLGAVAGKMEAAMRRGNDQAISEMGDNAIAAGFWYQAATQGATGEFWKKWVAATGRNEAATIRDVAAYGQQRELARWQTATLVAEKFAMSREGYLIQSEGANLAVAVSGPQQWERMSKEFMRAGVLTESQAAMVQAEGAAGVVRFAFDPRSGKGVQMTFQSGSTVSHEQITSDVKKDVISEEKARTVGLALLQPGSRSEAALRRELPQVLTGGDKQLLEQWKTDLAVPFANIAKMAKEGSVSQTIGGGIDLGVHLPRYVSRYAKAGVDISGSARRLFGETRLTDSSRAVVDNMLTESWKEATEKATVLATHNGVRNEQEFVNQRDKLAGDIFLEDYRTLYGTLENYAKDKGTGSILQDMRKEVKENKQWEDDQKNHPERMPWNQD